MRRWTAAAIVMVGLGVGRAARADVEPVVVVADDATTPVMKRLALELARGGYDVATVAASPDLDFNAEAALHHARVLLRLSPRGDTIDVWAADTVGHALRFRQRVTSGSGQEDPDLLAIRAQEAVHGESLTLAPDKSQPAHSPAPCAEAPRAAPAAVEVTRTVSASLGPSVGLGTGGVGAGAGVLFGLSWLATSRIALEGLARIPLVPSSVNAAQGTARVAPAFLGVGASVASSPFDAPLRASIGAGAALEWTHVQGAGSDAFVGHDDDLFSALVYLRASASVGLTGRLRLRLDALGGVVAPAQQIVFAGQRVATVGAPMIDAALSLEALW
jgi:hypothetical protein